MTAAFDRRRYIVRETAVGIVVNLLVSTVPGLLFLTSPAGSGVTPVHEVAVDLTPQFFMTALMSALAPSLLICWKQARGRLDVVPRPRPQHAAAIALGLAIASTVCVLATIRIALAPLATGGLNAEAIMALRAGQAALAAVTVTPVALLLLLCRS